MKACVALADALLKLSGFALMALGLCFWTGKLLQLIPLHIGLGVLLVFTLWALAGLGWRAGLGARSAILLFAWGFAVAAFGLAQSRFLPGPGHWIIQGLHFLVGGFTVALGARQARRIRAALPRTAGVSA